MACILSGESFPQNKDADLSVDLENGLGPEGMGIISVVDVGLS